MIRKVLAVILILSFAIPTEIFPRERKRDEILVTDVRQSALFAKMGKDPDRILDDRLKEAEKIEGIGFISTDWHKRYISRLQARFFEAKSDKVYKYLYGQRPVRTGASDYLTHLRKDTPGYTLEYPMGLYQYGAFVGSDYKSYPLEDDSKYYINKNQLKYTFEVYKDSEVVENCYVSSGQSLFKYEIPAFYDHARRKPYPLISKDKKRSFHYYEGFSASYLHLYPSIFWPYTLPIDSAIGYLGMIDDDLPEKAINKESPFIYVYNFKEFRKHNLDWYNHDILTYGYDDDCTDVEPEEKVTYGPAVKSPNTDFMRAYRSMIYAKTELAKKEMVKMLHPAPHWNDELGDYDMDYEKNIIDVTLTDNAKRLKDFSDRYTSVPSMDPLVGDKITYYFPMVDTAPECSLKEYEKKLREASNEEYWAFFLNFNAYDYHIADKIKSKDWKAAAKSGRELERYQLMRRYYVYKSLMRSKKQYDDDFSRYCTGKELNIAVWAGQESYGAWRHTSDYSLKYYIPCLDTKRRLGNTHGPKMHGFYKWPGEFEWMTPYGFPAHSSHPAAYDRKFNGTPSNTTGIIYAGYLDYDEFKDYCKTTGKSKEEAWRTALKGPLMIISDRTYNKYGAEYFEKVAGRKLKVVDITGTLQHCYNKLGVSESEAVKLSKNLLKYDYFFLKPSEGKNFLFWNGLGVMRWDQEGIAQKGWKDEDIAKIRRDPVSPVMPEYIDVPDSKMELPVVHPRFMNKLRALAPVIRTALEKDNREFPHMSQRYANYIEYFEGEPYEYPRPDHIAYYSRLLTEPLTKTEMGRRYPVEIIMAEFYDPFIKNKKDLMWVAGGKTLLKEHPLTLTAESWFVDNMLKKKSPRGVEVFRQIQRDRGKKIVEKLKGEKGDFIYNLQKYLANTIPWLAYNPHLYLAYYDNILTLRFIDEEISWWEGYGEKFRQYEGKDELVVESMPHSEHKFMMVDEFRGGICDGVMPVWGQYTQTGNTSLASQIAGVSAIKDTKIKNDKRYLEYMEKLIYLGRYYFCPDAVSLGRLRKRLDRKKEEMFPEPEIAVTTSDLSTVGYMPHLTRYISLKSPTGCKVRGTRIQAYGVINPAVVNNAGVYSALMPGMLLFPNAVKIADGLEYARVDTYTRSDYEANAYKRQERARTYELWFRDRALAEVLFHK